MRLVQGTFPAWHCYVRHGHSEQHSRVHYSTNGMVRGVEEEDHIPSRHLEGLDHEPVYLFTVGAEDREEPWSVCYVDCMGQIFLMPSQLMMDNFRNELQH